MEALGIKINQESIQKDQELFKVYLETYYEKTKSTTGHIKYGTAGFRNHAKNLPHVCLRVGIFTGLVAKICSQKVLGIVVTASHNPSEDNGIKQSDFDGGMIRLQLEKEVSSFVIEQDLNVAVQNLIKVLQTIEGFKPENKGMVFIGRDTRESGPYLTSLLTQGIESVGSEVKDFGVVTTPMIHYLVRYFNLEKHDFKRESSADEIVKTYYEIISENFNNFFANLPTPFVKKNDETILLDCSNGVGGIHIQKFFENMKDKYNIIPINFNDDQNLNIDCGAEYVHKKQHYPVNAVENLKKMDLSKTRCLSFDGDADRIVYYLPIEGFEKLHLLDGDRYISLFAKFFQTIFSDIQSLYEEIRKEGDFMFNEDLTKWQIGCVQTPYANGASTEYIKNTLKVGNQMSPNGVKNLHPRAHKYDVGIYCESNGHGTFVLKDDKNEALKSFKLLGDELLNQFKDNEKVVKFVKLLNLAYSFANTQNQINGDAMADFFCIEQALAYLNMTAYDWLALYTDKQCKNSTVVIRDRTKIRVNETEKPSELQQQINDIVAQFPGSRSFARPSGTEDIVRVYVEDNIKENISKITEMVSQIIINNKTIN